MEEDIIMKFDNRTGKAEDYYDSEDPPVKD